MQPRRIRWSRALVALAVALVTAPAGAQDPGSIPSSAIGGAAANRGLQLAQKRPYWSAGGTRAFVSSTLETGLVYYRPQLAIGYGKPHWQWIGVETQLHAAAGSGSAYSGVRAEAPFGEVRLGSRYSLSFNQSFLNRRATYDDETIDDDSEPNARFVSFEAETAGWVPIGDGALVGSAVVAYITALPEEYDVYVPQGNVVVEPPWLVRARGGYVHSFGEDGGLILGGAVELIVNPEREAYVVRIGPQLGVALTHHLDAAFSIMVPIASPDSLRLEGAELGQFGFRYRWATGDPFPEFP